MLSTVDLRRCTAQHSTVVTSLGGVEGVGGGDPLYVGGEGGVGEDVAPPVDSLHTPAQAHQLQPLYPVWTPSPPEHGLWTGLLHAAARPRHRPVADVEQAACSHTEYVATFRVHRYYLPSTPIYI